MPVTQLSYQMIGGNLQAVLLPSTAVAVGTYHFAEQPVTGASSGTSPGITTLTGYTLKTGAPSGSGDVLYAAGKYLNIVIVITNNNGGTLTATIGNAEAASNTFVTILVSAGLTANATTTLRVGPTYTAAANTIAQDILPLTWNLQLAVATATMTFSVGAYMGA